MDEFAGSMHGLLQGVAGRAPYLLAGFLTFAIFVLASRAAPGLAKNVGRRAGLSSALPILVGRIASFVLLLVGLLVAATIIFPSFRPADLLAGLGITSVAIGFAFKDILQNFFAGILLLWKQPFVIGDEIRVAGFEGIVEEIDTRSTRIRTYDGERAVLPNGLVYSQTLLVRTAYPDRRITERVRISYDTDTEAARTAAERALRVTEGVLAEPPAVVAVNELAPAAVDLVMWFWTAPRQSHVNEVRPRALENVKAALQAAGVEFADKNSLTLVGGDGLGT